ncbi:MAG: 3-deoxy-D-manno-octulosonic acid transferase [Vicingaceae bacterium]
MILFYNISIYLYSIAIKIASIFNPKATLFIKGRKNVFEDVKALKNVANIYWFHCASLGELEQGKPLIEKLKKDSPQIKIVLTFFSPSGYEYGKNYEFADYSFYLPLDTKLNAQKFIAAIKPDKVFFIKYEFWYHFLSELNRNKIPTYLISGIFRDTQPFFKWYGGISKQMLSFFTHFFVQNESSKKLLNKLGYTNVLVTGDTRLDRVYENSLSPKTPALIKKFADNKKIIIVGSSWPEEEKIIASFIKNSKKDYKYIIAPHNIDKKHITEIEKIIESDFIKYSDANYENIAANKILIIDNIGILASTYQFTDIAFIGGGFSGALHNILEPASFGNVVLFGPKHAKFHEAEELITINGAYIIKDDDDLLGIINLLEKDANLSSFQDANKNYIKSNKGAANKIVTELKHHF